MINLLFKSSYYMHSQSKKIKVWDIPVRVFHWSMLGLLIGLWWSADAGEMSLHQVFAIY